MPGGKMEQQAGVRLNNMRNGEKNIKYPRKRIETDNVKWRKEGTKHLLTDGYRLDVIFCNYYGGWEKKEKGLLGARLLLISALGSEKY